MEQISEEQFWKWAAANGIEPDVKYSSASDHNRFWNFPENPRKFPFFFSTMLQALEPATPCYLRVRGGVWPGGEAHQQIHATVKNRMLRGMGIPTGFHGAIRATDLVDVLVVAQIMMTFGSYVQEDLFVLPEHGSGFLYIDHHDVVHAQFREAQTLEHFVDYMASKRFDLPTRLPDATFKQPVWMKEETSQ